MRVRGAVILAGGASRRMGEDKALLRLEGRTFLERVAEALSGFEEVLLSVGPSRRYGSVRLRVVEDRADDCGPMGGLYSALKACESRRLLAVSCDMPLLTREFAEYLFSRAEDGYDALVPVTRDGRVQPLCAVYAERAAGVLEACLARGGRGITDALGKMKVKYLPLRHTPYADKTLWNVNTPEEYAALLRDVHRLPVQGSRVYRPQVYGPQVVAVCGVKNSGKTTLLEGVLPILRRRGLRTAAVKHDGHDFVPDVPGTDSFRLREAGAYSTAVYSDRRYALTVERSHPALEEIVAAFRDADLILLEGGKGMSCPKMEVVRAAVSGAAACPLDSLIGLCTDTDIRHPRHTLALDDYEGIAALLARFAART
jgi:molybdopterin-guanine dinucleotide biosynthesis protein MobB